MVKVETVGYARASLNFLYRHITEADGALIDIRMQPWSRRPEFQQANVQARFGARYLHLPEWGNVHYRKEDRGKGVQLQDFACGLKRLVGYVRVEKPVLVVLMCGCSDPNTCHRKTVVEQWQAQFLSQHGKELVVEEIWW